MTKLNIGIGFHCGEPSYARGIDDYFQSLADGGHQIFAKATDGTSSLLDAMKASPTAIGIWRKVFFEWNGQEIDDVPNYGDDPKRQAAFYMQQIMDSFPPELEPYRDHIYVEHPNEVDKNEANWIGEYLVECATIAISNGFKFAGPAWSTGEPEPHHWETPGMLEYLKMCELYPGDLAVTTHEYSLRDQLDTGSGILMGRVKHINNACAVHGIKPPTIFITEFGWHSTEAPPASEGVPQIVKQIEWYLEHTPNVKGIAIWALDRSSEWNDIYKVVQPYMVPLAVAINSRDWKAPEIEPPPPPAEKYKSVVMLAPQKADIDKETYLNIAAAAWDEYGRTLTQSTDNAIRMVTDPNANDQSHIVVWEPHQPSQKAAIKHINVAGVRYTTRNLASLAVDGLRFGPLFRYRYVVTDKFNAQRSYGNRLHEGADFDIIGGAADSQAQVLAIYTGVVVDVNTDPLASSYGKFVIVQCTNNGKPFYYQIAHLDEVFVRENQPIRIGEAVGELGNTGNSYGEHVHLNLMVPGYGMSGYVAPDVIDPLPFMPNVSMLPLINETKTVDLMPYFFPGKDYGPIYEVRHVTGQTETFQVQDAGLRRFKLVKNSQWEEFYYDNDFIWRGIDTSPGPAPAEAEHPGAYRFYIQAEAAQDAARWCKRCMSVGETYKGPGHYVQFYYKKDCEMSARFSGPATNQITFVKHWSQITFGDMGLVIEDIVELHSQHEKYWFARGIGMVAWENSEGQRSHIVEILKGRDNLRPEILPC